MKKERGRGQRVKQRHTWRRERQCQVKRKGGQESGRKAKRKARDTERDRGSHNKETVGCFVNCVISNITIKTLK